MIVTRQHVARFFTAVLLLCALNFITTFVWLLFLSDAPVLLKALLGPFIGFAWVILLGAAGVCWRAGFGGRQIVVWRVVDEGGD